MTTKLSGSMQNVTLWRYDVMSAEQIAALKEGRIAKPATQKNVAVERDSDSCKAASKGESHESSL